MYLPSSSATPESSVTLHFHKKRKLTELTHDEAAEAQAHSNIKIIDDLLESALIKSGQERLLKWRILPDMTVECKEFYYKYICCDITLSKSINKRTLGQKNNVWKMERSKRICAINAYRLFTYADNKKPNWDKKAEDYMNPSNCQTSAMKYGSHTESEAFSTYQEHYNCIIERLGFVVSPVLPWLGCSGYIPSQNKIVEFKCPVLGSTKKLSDVIPTLTYLDENQCLKTKHMYYCQVQLGMAVLNADSCDFVVFCKLKKELHVVNILFDRVIIDQYSKVLSNVYFKHILPILVSKKKTEEMKKV